MQVKRCRAMELWRRDTFVAMWIYRGMELWNSGDTLQLLATWRYGGLEASGKCSDVELRMYGGIDACCKRVDVEGSRYEGMQLWRRAGGEQ